MIEKEIRERLKALPYEVPSDISPNAISALMTVAETTTTAETQEVEEKFWQNLEQLSPEEQQAFFTSARETREQLSGVGFAIIAAVLILAIIWFVL